MKYFLLKFPYVETDVYTQSVPPTVRKMYQLSRGISRLEDWPDEALFCFSNDRPEGLNLTDCVANSFGLLIISGRFKELLESKEDTNLEFLSIQFADHKNRRVADDYWIGNFLTHTTVVDRERSEFEVDASDESMIFKFDRLALLGEIVNGGPPILRMQENNMIMMVREELVREIEEKGFSGMEFVNSEAFVSHPT